MANAGMVINISAEVRDALNKIEYLQRRMAVFQAQIQRLNRLSLTPGLNEAQQARINALMQQTVANVNSLGTASANTSGSVGGMANALRGLSAGLIVGGLAAIANQLTKTQGAFSQADIAISDFGFKIRSIGDDLDDLKSKMDFEKTIKRLKLQLQGFTGKELEWLMGKTGREQTVTFAGKVVEDLKEASKIVQRFDKLRDQIIDREGAIGGIAGIAIQDKGGIGQLLRDFRGRELELAERKDLISKLPENQKRMLQLYIDAKKKEHDLKKQLVTADREMYQAQLEDEANFYAQREELLKKKKDKDKKDLEELKRLAEERRRAEEKIIEGSKRLYEFYSDRLKLPVDLQISQFDNHEAALKKSREFTKKLSEGAFIVRVPAELDIVFTGAKIQEAKSAIGRALEKLEKELKVSPIVVPLGTNKSFDKFKKDTDDAVDKQKKELQEKFEVLAGYASGVLTPAFETFFDSIGSGEDAIKAFGDSVSQAIKKMIAQLAAMAAVAGILSIFGGGSFASLFKSLSGINISGKAAGGPVMGNTPYIIGEKGPELFVPSTSGRIVPNHQLGGIQGSASQMIAVTVGGVISGRNIALVLERENRYQTRGV